MSLNGMQNSRMKHLMQIPLHPGQVYPGGACWIVQLPAESQTPLTSTDWQRSRPTEVWHGCPPLGRHEPSPVHVPSLHLLELVVQLWPDVGTGMHWPETHLAV